MPSVASRTHPRPDHLTACYLCEQTAKVFDRFATTKVQRNIPSIASLLMMTAVAVYALLDLVR